MVTGTRKIASKNDLSGTLDHAHDVLIKSAKIASIFSAVCGFIYLLSYTTHAGIPFPLELSVLPTTLLIVGLTSLMGAFIIIAGIFMPAMTLDYNDSVTKAYREAGDIQEDVTRARFRRYFFCTWIPTALALFGLILSLGVIGNTISLKFLGAIAIFFSVGWTFYTPKYIGLFLEARLQYFMINTIQIILSAGAYVLIIIITVIILPDFDRWPGWLSSTLALIIFTIFQIAIFIPVTKNIVSIGLLSVDAESETTPAMGIALILAAACTLLTVITPQINYKIGGAALRVFHVGGNIPVAICLKTKPATAISRRFTFDTDFCSEKLSMELDSGGGVYVTKLSSIKVSNLENNTSRPEAVYFRQEEIIQKIYFHTMNANRN